MIEFVLFSHRIVCWNTRNNILKTAKCFRSYDCKRDKTNLALQLKAKIKSTGPITVADYMKEALTHPVLGYYMQKDVFGSAGDFTTSPEISQMFGEIVAVWCLHEWQKVGAPKPLQLVELGPGRGTLMRDVLRVFSHFKMTDNLSVHLVEVSPFLTKIQAQTLCVKPESLSDLPHLIGINTNGTNIHWYYDVKDVPHGFSIILAHEFFDALPIHKFQKTVNGWREILIDIDHEDLSNEFRFVISRSDTPASLFLRPKINQDHVEICPSGAVLIEHLATRLEKDGGFALIADYGHDGTKTDTIRAFKNHQIHDVLVDPGTADITADVDFSYLRLFAEPKVLTFGPISQNKFLKALGIDSRLCVLLKNCKSDEEQNLISGYNMMIDEDKMGERFKFFSMFPEILKDYLFRYPVTGFEQK